MLYAWGFDRVGVVASDLYFVDPEPNPGQEGAERGVRVEVRLLDRPPLTGSVYAAQPIVIDRPVWRGELFEAGGGGPICGRRWPAIPAATIAPTTIRISAAGNRGGASSIRP